MKMKTSIIAAFLSILGYVSVANHMVQEDTVVIEFGSNSKIVIYVESSEDLKNLESYDINEIIKDLNMSLDSSNNETNLVIQDESGSKYLKDTTIEVRQNDDNDNNNDDLNDSKFVWNADFDSSRDDDDDDKWDRKGFKYGVRKTRHYMNFDIGVSNWFEGSSIPNNTDYALKTWPSWYVAINSIQKTSIDGPLFIEWGPGVSFYNWKFQDTSTRILKGENEIEFFNAVQEPNISFEKTKLATSYFNFQVMPMLDFSYGKKEVKKADGYKKYTAKKRSGIRIGAGAYAGVRLGGRAVVVIEEDGDKDKSKDKSDFYLQNFRYGLRGQVGYKGFDFFATYDLNEVFTSNNGPKLNAFSFGVIF